MKSAYELAMERTGGGLKTLKPEQKKKIADLDSLYKSKIAELKISSDDGMKKARGNQEEIDKIRAHLSGRIAELEAKCEKEKEKIRNEVAE